MLTAAWEWSCTACLVVLMGCGAANKAPVEVPAASIANAVERPAWLGLVADEIDAATSCVRARAPEAAFVVHLQLLNDLRVGVVTLGNDGSVERCVHRLDEIEFRSRAKELRGLDFVGRPAVWPGQARPAWAVDAYLEEIVGNGATVAWVHWLGLEAR